MKSNPIIQYMSHRVQYADNVETLTFQIFGRTTRLSRSTIREFAPQLIEQYKTWLSEFGNTDGAQLDEDFYLMSTAEFAGWVRVSEPTGSSSQIALRFVDDYYTDWLTTMMASIEPKQAKTTGLMRELIEQVLTELNVITSGGRKEALIDRIAQSVDPPNPSTPETLKVLVRVATQALLGQGVSLTMEELRLLIDEEIQRMVVSIAPSSDQRFLLNHMNEMIEAVLPCLRNHGMSVSAQGASMTVSPNGASRELQTAIRTCVASHARVEAQ